MSFAKFFKDALLPVAVWTCGVLLSCFVLTVAGAPASIVVVAVGVSFIFGMLGIVIEYARRRRFLHQLERAAEELESPAWVQEMVQCPTYAEGELEYEVLRRVGKAACDEVAEGRRQTDDYRDYIESWVHEAKLPLAAAHLILENLDGSEDDLSRVDDLGRELARVERYIDQALYYARSEVVERDYLIRRWDLKTLVTGAIKANARELIAAHVAPVCENLDFEVFTDEKWLEFILGQLILKVPMGTVVRELDPETQTPMFEIADLVHDGERVVVAPGGAGGLGNTHFVTSVRRAPAFAQLGRTGRGALD